MLRRLLFTLTIVFLGFSPILQALFIVFSSFFSLMYLIKFMPHEDTNTAYFEVYNEVTILLVSYGMLLSCDYIASDVARYSLGWALTGIIILNVLLNFLNVVHKTGQKVKEIIKKLCLKLRKAKKGSDVSQALGDAAQDMMRDENTRKAKAFSEVPGAKQNFVGKRLD